MKTKMIRESKSSTRFRELPIGPAVILLLVFAVADGGAQDHWIVHHFSGADGDIPGGMILSGGTLYGRTDRGGSSNLGTVFKLNPNGSDFTVLKHFGGGDGAKPVSLTTSGSTIYGTTFSGGFSNLGTVFKLNPDGSGFTVLRHFAGADGAGPSGTLVASGTDLYGLTYTGGQSNRGTIFKVNTEGSGFMLIKEFTEPQEGGPGAWEGCSPSGNLVLSGTTLYGVTMFGGNSGAGTVFKVNTDGSDYAALKQGNLTDGGHFFCGVIVSGATLYGASQWGCAGGNGGVFRLNTDGTDFSVLKSFSGLTSPQSLLISGARLYGAAANGGVYNSGTVFTLDTEGNNFTFLKSFNGNDGQVPGIIVFSSTALYGTTGPGGNFNLGTVFGLSLPAPSILRSPPSQTAETGATVQFSATARGAPPLTYDWVFAGTNCLARGTNASLRLTNVQPSQIGDYTLVATNLYGAVTSSPAMLNVIPPTERRLVPGIDVRGEAGSVLQVDYANDFGLVPNWLPLDTISLTSTSQFCFDLVAPLPPLRYYRSWQTGPANLSPMLDLQMIPALTLTSNSGEKIRVDGINQIGPTDAWFTLATVTMTNTTQLYFDVTAHGQPARLYRFVPVP